MPPPTSGGIAVAQMLKILEPFDFSRIPVGSTQAIHLIAEAGKLAFADRNRYVGDPDYVNVPVEGLLDPIYLASRSATISADKAMDKAKPGNLHTTRKPNLHPIKVITDRFQQVTLV